MEALPLLLWTTRLSIVLERRYPPLHICHHSQTASCLSICFPSILFAAAKRASERFPFLLPGHRAWFGSDDGCQDVVFLRLASAGVVYSVLSVCAAICLLSPLPASLREAPLEISSEGLLPLFVSHSDAVPFVRVGMLMVDHEKITRRVTKQAPVLHDQSKHRLWSFESTEK